MKYADAETYLLNFETEIPDADLACGTHMGFYLAWAVNNALVSDGLSANADAVRNRTASGRDLLFDRCDGKLTSEDLNERGNAFTQEYYESRYLSDYQETFAPDAEDPEELFKVADTWSNYEKVAQRLDSRFRGWQAAAALPNRVALLRTMEAEFVPWLDRMGFIRDPYSFAEELGRYIRKGPWGEHSITLWAIDDRPKFYGMAVEVGSTLNVLARVVRDDLAIDNPRQSSVPPATFHDSTHQWLGKWPVPLHDYRGGRTFAIPITDSRQIQPAIAMVRKRAESELPGLLETLESLAGHDRLFCTGPLSTSPWFRGNRTYVGYISCVRLLCAEMSANPHVLAMCDEIEQALDSSPELKHPDLGYAVREMRGRLKRIRDRAASK